METCKHGSGAGSRKPTAAMRQGAECRAYDALQGLANKLFPPLFPENYSFAERKNFTGNALQSDGIKRGSPNLRLETQPATAGMGRISDNGEIIEKGG